MDLLASPRGRRVLFGALYASEGAPIGFLWWYLPTVLASEGVEVARIGGLTAALALPWAFKFLWAPLVDVLRGPRWGFRAWIVATQSVMTAAFLPLFFLDLQADFGAISVLMLVHAVAAATQDVAIDALAIGSTPREELGSLSAWMTAGKYAGRALMSGGALALVDRVGPHAVYAVLVAMVGGTLLLVLGIREPAGPAAGGRKRFAKFLDAVKGVAGRRTTWLALLFASVAAAGFEAAGGLSGPFMVHLGLDKPAIAFLYAVPFTAGTILGGLLGGWVFDRLGPRRSVAIFQALFAAVVLALGGTAS